MLYRLSKQFSELEPVAFSDFSRYQLGEKHLEQLLCRQLFNVLFEGTQMLPFHQEKSFQPEGDIYALQRNGDLVIFELKLATAGDDALDQLFRYVQKAGQWNYGEIDKKFRGFPNQSYGASTEVRLAHADAFDLTEPLKPEEFNRAQQMIVVGNAADQYLIRAVEFWRNKGLSIDFCPYRIFEINGEPYFEFFAKPYDVHTNPGEAKGVLFDTNRAYYPSALQWMIQNKRISAFGSRKEAVKSLSRGDLVFYSHKWVGLVAAARVTGKKIKSGDFAEDEELYWDVTFETEIPSKFDDPPQFMPFPQVKEVTGKSFFWARTQKVPYLTAAEANQLLNELRTRLAPVSQAGGQSIPTASVASSSQIINEPI